MRIVDQKSMAAIIAISIVLMVISPVSAVTHQYAIKGNLYVENENQENENLPTLTIPSPAETDIVTQLVVSPSRFRVRQGQSRTLVAILRTIDNVPLAGKTINWYASGVVSPENGVTDNYGKVSVTYTALENVHWDNIIAWFAGDNQYQGSAGYSIARILPW